MARGNTAILYGIIQDKPTIKINEKGEFVVARIKLLTVRRSKANEEMRLQGSPRTDVQYVITRNPAMIEKIIVPLRKGDVILVKGTISTREVNKKFICPYCHETNLHEGGVMNYVDPIFIERTNETPIEDEQEETEKLLSKAEISNICWIFGTLCRPPEYYQGNLGNSAERHKEECDFQIACNRIRRIKEDDPDKTTDYPYVKTFGPRSKEYSEVLHVGSEIFINGSIQAREVEMIKTCEYCGNSFEAKGATMEIVPYSIEYIDNCDIPESKHNNEEENEIEEDFEEVYTSDEEYIKLMQEYSMADQDEEYDPDENDEDSDEDDDWG